MDASEQQRRPMAPVNSRTHNGDTAHWLHAQQQGSKPAASKPTGPDGSAPLAIRSASPERSITRARPGQGVSTGADSQAEAKFKLSGKEKLYEAYNDLHALAQVFSKPFDAPAILVVGQQTDGKSGAILLGFAIAPSRKQQTNAAHRWVDAHGNSVLSCQSLFKTASGRWRRNLRQPTSSS